MVKVLIVKILGDNIWFDFSKSLPYNMGYMTEENIIKLTNALYKVTDLFPKEDPGRAETSEDHEQGQICNDGGDLRISRGAHFLAFACATSLYPVPNANTSKTRVSPSLFNLHLCIWKF